MRCVAGHPPLYPHSTPTPRHPELLVYKYPDFIRTTGDFQNVHITQLEIKNLRVLFEISSPACYSLAIRVLLGLVSLMYCHVKCALVSLRF